MKAMNFLSAFEQMLDNVVEKASTPREKFVAQVVRDAVHKVSHDLQGLKDVNEEETLVTVLEGHAKAVSACMALLSVVATIGVNDPKLRAEFFGKIIEETEDLAAIIARGSDLWIDMIQKVKGEEGEA